MNTRGVALANRYNLNFCPAFGIICLWMVLILTFCLPVTEVEAAKIVFEPIELSATVAPGDNVTVPVSVSLADTTAPNSYASFSISRINGTLDPSWINNGLYVSLNPWYKTRQVPFQVKVPADAKGGKYKSVFRTVWLKSNEQVDPADLVINVEVSEAVDCNQAPLFSDIFSTKDKINARNNKQVAIDLSGSVSSPNGCDIVNAWFELTDEYLELNRTEPLVINDDGTFSVSVQMVASRRGNDKDGRLYTVKFKAVNETGGVGESPDITVVVLHDNRKK